MDLLVKSNALRSKSRKMRKEIETEDNGRFYTRGRIMRLDELGQTFVTDALSV